MRASLLISLLLFSGWAHAERPNVLLITIDTLRADHLGSYGHPSIRTPHLDSLAKGSLFFELAFAPAPLTLPSHTSLMTGRYPFRHGTRDNAGSVRPEEKTLAEILKENGYHTYAFIGGFPLEHRFGLNQGFDVYNDEFPRRKHRALDFGSERPADAVVNAVKQADIREPFFVWVHFYDPHAPYDHGGYAGEVESVDRSVGDLLQLFPQERTIITVAGDHGESLGEHGEQTHRIFVYDSTMRVPFFVKGPQITAQRIRAQVRLVDYAPTILNLLKIPIPAGLDGVILPSNAGKTALLESMFPRYQLGWSPLTAVRTHQWKYIETVQPELYRVDSDPAESRNIVQQQPEVAAKLRSMLPEAASTDAKPAVSPETAEQLAALGYVSGGEVPFSGADPKERISVWNAIERAVDLESKNPEQAGRLLEEARKKDPRNPMLLLSLSDIYAKTGRAREARQILDRLIQQDPQNVLALTRMVRVSLMEGRPEAARKWLGIIRSSGAASSEYHLLSARASLHMGDLESSASDLDEALRLDPGDTEARVDLANVHLQTGKRKEAQTGFETVLRADPESLQALNGMATVKFLSGDYSESEVFLKKALAMDSADAQTLMNLALLYSKSGRSKEAMEIYKQVIASPRAPPDWKERASVLLKELEP